MDGKRFEPLAVDPESDATSRKMIGARSGRDEPVGEVQCEQRADLDVGTGACWSGRSADRPGAVENSPRSVAAPNTHRSGGVQGFCMYRETIRPRPLPRQDADWCVRHSSRERGVRPAKAAIISTPARARSLDRDDDQRRVVLEGAAGEGGDLLGEPRLRAPGRCRRGCRSPPRSAAPRRTPRRAALRASVTPSVNRMMRSPVPIWHVRLLVGGIARTRRARRRPRTAGIDRAVGADDDRQVVAGVRVGERCRAPCRSMQ